MSKFKNQQETLEIGEENAGSELAHIVKQNKPFEPSVQEFRFNHLSAKPPRGGVPRFVNDHYGAKGANAERGQRDRRFVMSNLAREALLVNQEERRLIDQEVGKRVGELAEVAKAAGREQGYGEGLKRGKAEAFAQAQFEAAERLTHFEAMVSEMEEAKLAVFRQNEKFLIDLVYHICKGMLLRELKTDRDYLVRLATELIEKAGLRENLSIKIHPQDADTVASLREGIEARLGSLRNLRIEASEEVRRGGCMLETEWGAIDASIETQLNQVLSALDDRPESAPPGGKG